MKPHLEKKIKSLFAIAGTLGLTNAGAQVIYTDVNPDVVITDTIHYDLDLNGDNIIDYRLLIDQLGAAIKGQSSPYNGAMGRHLFNYGFPYAFSYGNQIGGMAGSWIDNTITSLDQCLACNAAYTPGGYWWGRTDKYLGVRFEIAGQYHYGWARLSVSSAGDTIILKDYAYDAIGDSAVWAGQPTGISNVNNSGIFVSYSPLLHAVEVLSSGQNCNGNISIFTMEGKLIREEEITGQQMTLSADNLTTGIYLIKVQQGDVVVTKKIYVM